MCLRLELPSFVQFTLTVYLSMLAWSGKSAVYILDARPSESNYLIRRFFTRQVYKFADFLIDKQTRKSCKLRIKQIPFT